ncbi:MAG: T9SS type A sorting domain-containing protein [Bacteroidia bacterium]|nr:T9SS type A sorting domain-containing protein [Bacteroidia bacterium]
MDTLWTRTYFQQDQYLTFWDCVEAPDHGYVVAGTRYTSNINSNDIMIMKIDNNGNYQWQNIVSSPGVDYGLKIINTFDKGYLIYGQKDFFNNRNPYIVKFDSSGSFIWDRTFGNPNISDGMSLNGLISTKDSNYVIASDFGVHETVNGTDTFCGYLVKFNDSGNIIWEKKYKNNLRIYLFNSLAELDNSDMIVVGLKDSGSGYFVDGELVKLTPDGEILWKRTINDNEISPSIYECSLMSIKKTADGGYAMAGWLFIDTINPLPLYRMWFVKTDSMGCDGVNSCIDTALAFTTRYSQDIVFEGDSVLVMVDINNGNGPFSALLPDSNILNPLYIFRDSCSFGFYAHPTVQYNHLPLTVFNNYTQTVTDTLYFYVLPNNDISRLDANNYKVNISPNPASNQVTFELSPQIKSEIKITIFNSYGQAIADYHTLNSSLLLDVRSYSNGVYYLRINSQYITLVKKFVIFK